MTRLFDCGVLLRIYTMLVSGLYAYTGLYQSTTLVYGVAHADEFSLITMKCLAVLAVLGSIDLTINDLLPARFVILRALHDRHLVHMGIAACFGIQMYTCVVHQLPRAVLPFYGIYALLVPIAAFADIRARYKNKAG